MSKNRHYSRIITALSPKKIHHTSRKAHHHLTKTIHGSRNHVAFFIVIYLLLLLPIFFSLARSAYKNLSDARKKEIYTRKQLNYWQNVIQKHPNYPDAYYQAALTAIQLGDKSGAIWFLESSLLYDPYFKKAEELLLELKKG